MAKVELRTGNTGLKPSCVDFGASLSPLLRFAKSLVPMKERTSTKLLLFASPELQDLGQEIAVKLLKSCGSVLRSSGFWFKDDWARNNKSCFLISQLDDWVLCRVQQKGNTSKKTCNSQGSSPEYWSCLQRVEQTQHASADLNTEMTNDFLYKDCTLLVSILAGQAPPISSVSFQRTNDGYEVGTNYKE